MRYLDIIAAKYYHEFEIHDDYSIAVLFSWMILLILGLGFGFSGYLAFEDLISSKQKHRVAFESYAVWLMMILEILFLWYAQHMVNLKRDRVNIKLGIEEHSKVKLEDKKRNWLKRELDARPNKFLNIAKNYRESIDLAQSYRSFYEAYWLNLPSRIYHSESRARVLSLFVFLFSITFLTVRSVDETGEGAKLLFELYGSGVLFSYLFSLALVAFIIFVAIESVVLCMYLIKVVFYNAIAPKSTNLMGLNLTRNYLIKELASLYIPENSDNTESVDYI